MNPKGRLLQLAVLLFGIWASVPFAHGQADFYKGKSITVIVGTTPGAYTINGRGFLPRTWEDISSATPAL
jgi:hypothetical protein